MNMGFGGFQDLVMHREAWRAAVHRVAESDATEQQQLSALCVDCGAWRGGNRERGEGPQRLSGQGKTPCPQGPASLWGGQGMCRDQSADPQRPSQRSKEGNQNILLD